MVKKLRHPKLLAALYAGTLLGAIILWLILYARGVVFHFAGVYLTPGIFSAALMVVVGVVIFLIASPH